MLKVVCVGARSLARAQEFADRFGIKKAYGSYEEVASDADVGKMYWYDNLTKFISLFLIHQTFYFE